MFSKKKSPSKIDYEQRELYENARKRAKQKKRLFQHFVIFLIGAVFLIVLNVIIGYQEDFKPLGYNWFVWAVLLWTLIFLVHFFNVLIVNSLMGKDWEAKQVDKLVKKQKEKIAQLQEKVERDFPLPRENKDIRPISTDKKISPENPDKPINS
ncbi:2TM domain-containing protein [Christiangramia sabulilitoris]|uniref:2TM domain-containing protein n=1 Tax=Christiangramia sabulilitoris TaxID=2583991 RepID=A0A550HZM4_9FLAO|nr:2TM domain-containing protein [Christiangramia sabulilitoris]TRO64135.1 2TM domain-containing protein [Christiangramia sabulilitoris]